MNDLFSAVRVSDLFAGALAPAKETNTSGLGVYLPEQREERSE
jgi:hypothetical protein